MASLSTLPMDYSRPLWEVHLLDFLTSEAASTIALRFHHALGDGTSLISLFIACTRSASDSTALPAMPPPPTHRRSPIYALPQDRRPLGVLANAAWILSHYIMLVWHTVVDVACFLALLFAGDKQTVFKGVKGVEFRRKRFISRSLSLGDVKHIKNTLGCVSITSCRFSSLQKATLNGTYDIHLCVIITPKNLASFGCQLFSSHFIIYLITLKSL